jgi:ADP-heptose:LPS heptosyltransferase
MNKLFHLNPKKIAIFRALQIGDLLCAIPAVRALKNAYPEAEITLLGMPWAESFVRRFSHYFSGFIHFPGYPGLPEQAFQVDKFISFLQESNRQEFDLVIQMHGNGSIINPIMGMLGAKKTAGFCEPGRYRPDPELFMHYPEGLHEIERHLSLIQFLGISAQENQLEFPVNQEEHYSFEQLCKAYDLQPKKYVCVHSGARDTRRWWPPQQFAQVADSLVEKGYDVVLTGTEIERGTVEQVARLMRYPAINCVGKTDLGTLAVLIKNAKMLFSNDTGVSHIAAAVQTPSVVIFLASDPTRWAPLNRHLHYIILPQEAENMEYVFQHVESALKVCDFSTV